jgi:hypothetical protein
MATVLQPWQILVATFAGWISREQDAVIEYLREENRVLRQQLGRRRLRLTDVGVAGSLSAARPSGDAPSQKLHRSSRRTPFYVGIDNSLPRSGPTSGDPRGNLGSWKSSPNSQSEWPERIRVGDIRASKARSTTSAIGLDGRRSPIS